MGNKLIKDGIKNMGNNAKRKFLTGALYLALALTVVAILLTAVFTSNRKNAPPDADHFDIYYEASPNAAVTEELLPAAVTEEPAPVTTPPKTTAPADEPPSRDVAAGEEEAAEVAAPRPLIFAMPAQGYLINTHDEEMLVFSPTMNDYRVHVGVDIATSDGAAVMACAEGTIRNIYDDPLMGRCIAIDHGNGLVSYYKNLSEQTADGMSEGVKVSRGDIIGSVGATALIEISEEPHLHFEMTKSGSQVNPLDYIPYSESEIYEG